MDRTQTRWQLDKIRRPSTRLGKHARRGRGIRMKAFEPGRHWKRSRASLEEVAPVQHQGFIMHPPERWIALQASTIRPFLFSLATLGRDLITKSATVSRPRHNPIFHL